LILGRFDLSVESVNDGLGFSFLDLYFFDLFVDSGEGSILGYLCGLGNYFNLGNFILNG
jgi:hypothetical protein